MPVKAQGPDRQKRNKLQGLIAGRKLPQGLFGSICVFKGEETVANRPKKCVRQILDKP